MGATLLCKKGMNSKKTRYCIQKRTSPHPSCWWGVGLAVAFIPENERNLWKMELRMMKFLAFSKLLPPSKILKPSGFHHSSAQTGLRDRLSAARAFSISCKELLAGSANHWRKLTVAWHPEKTMATVSPVFPNKDANREKVAPYKTIMEAKGLKHERKHTTSPGE